MFCLKFKIKIKFILEILSIWKIKIKQGAGDFFLKAKGEGKGKGQGQKQKQKQKTKAKTKAGGHGDPPLRNSKIGSGIYLTIHWGFGLQIYAMLSGARRILFGGLFLCTGTCTSSASP